MKPLVKVISFILFPITLPLIGLAVVLGMMWDLNSDLIDELTKKPK